MPQEDFYQFVFTFPWFILSCLTLSCIIIQLYMEQSVWFRIRVIFCKSGPIIPGVLTTSLPHTKLSYPEPDGRSKKQH